MSNNLRVLLIGAGYMGKEYSKVLKAQNVEFDVVCRKAESAESFYTETGIMPITGGVEKVMSILSEVPTHAIVAINIDQLYSAVKSLIGYGIKNILVEKPGGLGRHEITDLSNIVCKNQANVFVAYNRRFYSSTEKALDIIEEDGGVSSFNFEFTEWNNILENAKCPQIMKEEALLCNSSHVIDLAFFIGGYPLEMTSYISGSLPFHSRCSKYSGAGRTDKDALFSYQANWDAPGRWGLEVLTSEHRLYFRPMEKLSIQNKGTVRIEEVPIDDKLDLQYKPGLFKQVEAFLSEKHDNRLLTIDEQLKHLDFYEKIDGISSVNG